MITRVEITGFKTFEDFAMDLSPVTILLGPNGAGKSNLFDAIHLLTRLAEFDVREAMKAMRGEPRELFRRLPQGGHERRMALAVEVLVPPVLSDPWGVELKVQHTRIRYEVAIELHEDGRGIERAVVTHERASPISKKEDTWSPEGRCPSRAFQRSFLRYSGRSSDYLSTESSSDQPTFRLFQDGRAGRARRERPAHGASSTVLSSIRASDEFPHLYALRQTIRSWRFLHLDPSRLRAPSSEGARDSLEPDGANLAFVLHRIRQDTADQEHIEGILPEIAAELARIVPGVSGLTVQTAGDRDKHGRVEYRVEVSLAQESPFSARVLSDGTLRVLALLTMIHDPTLSGTVCFEEPENGIHPERLRTLVERVAAWVTDPGAEEAPPDEPLLQLLMNSHSPVVLSAPRASPRGQLAFVDTVAITDPASQAVRRRTRVRQVQPHAQGELLVDRERAFVPDTC